MRRLYIDQSATATGIAYKDKVSGKIEVKEFNLNELKKETYSLGKEVRKSKPEGEFLQHSNELITIDGRVGKIYLIKSRKTGKESKWFFEAKLKDDEVVFISWTKIKTKIEKRKYTDEERQRILFTRLDYIVKTQDIREIVYEEAGAVSKRWDAQLQRMVPVANVQTLLKLGQIVSTIMLVAYVNKLPATRTIRPQTHQEWVRIMLTKAKQKTNIEEVWDKRLKKYKVKHLTKKDSKLFASLILKREISQITDNESDALCMLCYDEATRRV